MSSTTLPPSEKLYVVNGFKLDDHMHLSKSHCRRMSKACSGCYTEVKNDIQILFIKRAQTDWQRCSDVPMNTCCVVHIHRKYLRTKNIHSIKNIFLPKTKNTSTREKKKVGLHNSTCFFFNHPFFCCLFWIFGG